MKFALRALLGGLLLAGGSVRAQDGLPAAEPLSPLHLGYAFERPDLLLQQRIFGLAHGVHLLLSGCLDKNENAVAAQQAYDTWHAAQREALDAVRITLAAHHYGDQAGRAQWQDIARVIGLKAGAEMAGKTDGGIGFADDRDALGPVNEVEIGHQFGAGRDHFGG